MKLLTQALREALIAAGKRIRNEGSEPTDEVIAKFFDPCGRWTYYVFDAEEVEGDLILFGYCVSPLGPDCDEWGYSSFNEIAATKNRLGLHMERDLWLPKVTRAEIRNGARP